MLSANFKPKRTAAASRGFLATARLSCFVSQLNQILSYLQNSFAHTLNLINVNKVVAQDVMTPQARRYTTL